MRAWLPASVVLGCALLAAALPFSAKVPATFASASQLVDSKGRTVTLADVAEGEPIAVVLMKGTHCRVCTAELERLAERTQELTELGVKVVALNAETPATNAELKAQLRLPFPVLSDKDGTIAKREGYWMPSAETPLPGVWWVDRCGEIVGRYEGRRPGRIQTQMIVDGLRALAHRRTCGQSI